MEKSVGEINVMSSRCLLKMVLVRTVKSIQGSLAKKVKNVEVIYVLQLRLLLRMVGVKNVPHTLDHKKVGRYVKQMNVNLIDNS